MLALRLADAINAITGLWIIPSYLPEHSLGAVLPLFQIGALFAIPVTIFTTVFTRHLCAYAVQDDAEKTRGLLRDALMGTILLFGLSIAITTLLIPWLCAFLRIPHSAAAYYAIGYGLLAAFTPMAWSALQALRRFGAISLGSLLAAPIRLIAMIALLPLLRLTGYFIGQTLPLIVMLIVAGIVLRPLLTRKTKTPFLCWRGELQSMTRYAGFITLGTLVTALQGTLLTFIIRHRLSDDVSGAYYILTRFSEIATYCGSTLATVLFPFAIEARIKGFTATRFRGSLMSLILVIGICLAAILYWLLPWIFTLIPTFSAATQYAPHAAYLTLITTLNAASTLHFTQSAAEDRFTYFWYSLPCALFLSLGLLLLPNLHLLTIFHLMAITALLQFIGCLIDSYLSVKMN